MMAISSPNLISNPDGTNLVGSTLVTGAGTFIDTRTLPAAGTYTIAIDPSAANVGSMTMTLYDVPADATAPISPGGAAATLAITTPGQNGRVTFAGTAGQRMVPVVASGAGCSCLTSSTCASRVVSSTVWPWCAVPQNTCGHARTWKWPL